MTEEKKQELLRLFPEIRTEDGKIDFDRQRLVLGEKVDVGKERYGMNWPGKAECFRTIQTPSTGTLLPLPEESIDFDTIENLIIEGDNRVEKGYPRFTTETGSKIGRVHINASQYFEGVPQETWQFQVGGYQVLDKWLKDRRERLLTFDDLTHYQKVVVALSETMRLMDEIDAAIPAWPIE